MQGAHALAQVMLLNAAWSACRVSHYCRVRFVTATGREDCFIAEVQCFVRASKPNTACQRLAVCRLMKASVTRGMLKVTAAQLRSTDVRMVEVDMIDCKLVTARSRDALYGMPYCNTSRMA